uniref:ADP-ribose pyrophosphatase, mitochondrial n=1 Tax=Esox lucius TaxID=8010 RepID=A0A3P8Z8B4_ESOLU
MIRLGGNWLVRIRIALTVLGFPYCLCTSRIRPPISCSAAQVPAITVKSVSTSACSAFTMFSAPNVKARCLQYPGSEIQRVPVPDDKVDWKIDWHMYSPVSYTAPVVLNKPVWADPDIGSFSPRFNSLDGKVDRRSHEGEYRVENGIPINPHSRTGLTGRGLLGRWGPNHAADPIVTRDERSYVGSFPLVFIDITSWERWKRDSAGLRVFHPVSKMPVLQFVSIKRKDCLEWALPGGMVDPGELVSLTLQREFSEEALNSLDASPEETERIHERITALFGSQGLEVYKGYVDDPRNTDNSWMETVAVNFHDETGNSVSELPLQAGDDAGQVQWIDIDSALSLYASHSHFLEVVAKKRNAHW